MIKRSYWSLPYLIFMVVFVVLPLLLIVLYAFQDGSGHFTFANISRFFTDSDSLSTFALSIEVAIENTLICVLLGYPAAWILSNKKLNRSAVTVKRFELLAVDAKVNFDDNASFRLFPEIRLAVHCPAQPPGRIPAGNKPP